MSKLITLTSPVYNSFIIGSKLILPANLSRQFVPSQMQVLPDICAEMCRPSSTTLAVHFPASMGFPPSFCDWKKLRKFSAASPANFPLLPSGWWLTFSRPPDVQPRFGAEMCRPSSTTLAVHFLANTVFPPSFCD